MTDKAPRIAEGFKADVVAAGTVTIEIGSVVAILPRHEAPLHTYRPVDGLRIRLILNFNAPCPTGRPRRSSGSRRSANRSDCRGPPGFPRFLGVKSMRLPVVGQAQ